MVIDDKKKDLSLQWHDVYDLNVKTGAWKPVEGKTYYGKDALTAGEAYKQEAVSDETLSERESNVKAAADDLWTELRKWWCYRHWHLWQ